MTTIVVVRKGDVACIAADTLSVFDDMKEDVDHVVNHDKLVRVGSAVVGAAGSAAIGLVLESYFQRKAARKSFKSAIDVFETMRVMHEALIERYHLLVDEDAEEGQFGYGLAPMVIAAPSGIYRTGGERSVAELARFDAVGSGRAYAMGAMNAVWDQHEDAEAIARIGLETAARFDVDTGLPITIAKVELQSKLH